MLTTVESVALPTGVTLPYVEQGDPSGLPVILLHGYSDSWRSFELLLPHLPDHLRALALTQRGHGDATRPEAGYRVDDFASDLAAFMDTLELPAAVVVGHSGGTATAQHVAVAHPGRALGLVLIGAAPTFRGNPGVLEVWDAVSELADPVDPEFVREFQESTVTQPVPDAFLDTIITESRKLPARVWRDALRGLLEAGVPSHDGAITAPTLLLWGDRDELCSRGDQEALTAAIAGARLVTYAGTGHAVHWEQPERVAADLVAFAEGLA